GGTSAAHARGGEPIAAARGARATAPPDRRRSSVDRRRDAGAPRRPRREARDGVRTAARHPSSRLRAHLERSVALHGAAAEYARRRERRRAPGRAPRHRSHARTTQATPRRPREPVLPGGDRPYAGGGASAGRRAGMVSPDATDPRARGATDGSGRAGGAYRSPRSGRQAPAADGLRRRQRRSAFGPSGHRRAPGRGLPPGARSAARRAVPL